MFTHLLDLKNSQSNSKYQALEQSSDKSTSTPDPVIQSPPYIASSYRPTRALTEVQSSKRRKGDVDIMIENMWWLEFGTCSGWTKDCDDEGVLCVEVEVDGRRWRYLHENDRRSTIWNSNVRIVDLVSTTNLNRTSRVRYVPHQALPAP